MTPTLFGRIQTRILLLLLFGLPISWFFSVFGEDYDNSVYAAVFYVIIFGCAWDILYNYIQTFRWDRDWPPVFQLIAGIVEGAFIWLLIRVQVALPGFSRAFLNSPEATEKFWTHYSVVWVFTFLASLSLMRILFLKWRYHGGEWI